MRRWEHSNHCRKVLYSIGKLSIFILFMINFVLWFSQNPFFPDAEYGLMKYHNYSHWHIFLCVSKVFENWFDFLHAIFFFSFNIISVSVSVSLNDNYISRVTTWNCSLTSTPITYIYYIWMCENRFRKKYTKTTSLNDMWMEREISEFMAKLAIKSILSLCYLRVIWVHLISFNLSFGFKLMINNKMFIFSFLFSFLFHFSFLLYLFHF